MKRSEQCPITTDFIKGMMGATKKLQPKNHILNQKKTKKVVV